ncbi:MAG: nucleotidyltransferase domain-containing protein, partial [Thermaerobacter sp.]|nr:nucleotidyltransferase domain-containing protein [Thermaerobacter sp.]
WRRRAQQERAAIRRHRRRAKAMALRLAALLQKEFGARTVFLFGSTATGHHYDLHSDIDLAAEGIPPERELAATARITGFAAPEFAVDLLTLEHCPDLLRQRVEEEGVLLAGNR